mmetsp:Transcript_17971/g.42814  ORF Transcript_17971/g.42814 Transcript_17971/m.42814 type:complete len:279 (+) Transcript_17971:416-1252(+)
MSRSRHRVTRGTERTLYCWRWKSSTISHRRQPSEQSKSCYCRTVCVCSWLASRSGVAQRSSHLAIFRACNGAKESLSGASMLNVRLRRPRLAHHTPKEPTQRRRARPAAGGRVAGNAAMHAGRVLVLAGFQNHGVGGFLQHGSDLSKARPVGWVVAPTLLHERLILRRRRRLARAVRGPEASDDCLVHSRNGAVRDVWHLATPYLPHDDAEGVDVGRLTVLSVTSQHLWSTPRQRPDKSSECVGPLLALVKVGNFARPSLIDEDVERLEISVQYLHGV